MPMSPRRSLIWRGIPRGRWPAIIAFLLVQAQAAFAQSEHTISLVPAASNTVQQGFVRVINHSDRPGEVRIHAIDDSGERFGPVSLSLEARATRHFNSQDLERGNLSRGLSGGVGDGDGNWRLEMETELDIEPLAYIRTGDGFITSMHEGVRESARRHHVPLFNPGSNRSQRSRLRLINPTEESVEVTLTGRDDEGAPGGEVRLTLEAGMARTLTAQELESGGTGFSGSLGDGTGKWQLFVSADAPIEVMSLLQSPTGHLASLFVSSLVDEPVGPALRISHESAYEGDPLTFTVTLDRAPISPVTYYYATYPGTAQSNDYSGHTVTALTFNAGVTSRTITVLTTEDTRDENGELFYVYITASRSDHPSTGRSPSPYLARGTGTILDDDEHEPVLPDPRISYPKADEGDPLTLTVTLDRAPSSPATYYYATYPGSAQSNDYSGRTVTALTFNAGVTSHTITIPTIEDTRYEDDELFYVYITASRSDHRHPRPSPYLAVGSGTILDDDRPAPRISSESADEGDPLTFTVTLDRAPSSPVTYYYSTGSGSAQSNDYSGPGRTKAALTFNAGVTSRTITIPTTEDARDENDEWFTVYIRSAHRILAEGRGTIHDDDGPALPTAPRISSESADEGDPLTFTVTLLRAPISPVTYYYATYPGTAESNDYSEHTVTALTFNAGVTSRTITVLTTEDTRDENDEWFTVYITASRSDHPSTGRLPSPYLAKGIGTIHDDDEHEPTLPAPRISHGHAYEGDPLTFTFTLIHAPISPVTYYYATYPGTAQSNDYSGRTATALTFNAGVTSHTITIPTIEDTRYEDDELFYVYITASRSDHRHPRPSPYLAVGSGTILDDDRPAPRISSESADEGDPLTFTVTLDRAPSSPVTYYYSTGSGSAQSNDYSGPGRTKAALTFNAGVTSRTITIPTTEDARDENDEWFTVYIRSARRILAEGTGTIRDDD